MTKRIAMVTAAALSIGQKATFNIVFSLDGGGSARLGNIPLDGPGPNQGRIPDLAGWDLVLRLLRVFGVNSLEATKGRILYVLIDKDEVVGIEMLSFHGGHKLMIKDWHRDWATSADE